MEYEPITMRGKMMSLKCSIFTQANIYSKNNVLSNLSTFNVYMSVLNTPAKQLCCENKTHMVQK